MYCKKCGAQMNEEQVICTNCGVEKGKGNEHCPNCGHAVVPEAVVCVHCGVSLKRNTASTIDPTVLMSVKKREIVKALIFSIITCGIYAIYWFIKLNDEINRLVGKAGDTSGGVAFVLNLITCGIYGVYWGYQMGKKRDVLANDSSGSSHILYLVLMIFGLGIVAYALMQDAINKAIEQ